MLSRVLAHARKIVSMLKYSPHPEVVSEPQTGELSRAFTQQVTQTWFEGQFDPTLIDLSQAKAQTLNHYLYTNAWMVQCIEAGIGISRKAWDAIVARLLQPASAAWLKVRGWQSKNCEDKVLGNLERSGRYVFG